ncbi:MAG: endonuclease MutS2 [Clostridia bacterium]|nr:endonuclease MutS2 [Clostridia bacterium]
MKNSAVSLELDKILSAVSFYAVLEAGKERVRSIEPTENFAEAKRLLDTTEEATRLLFDLGAGRVEEFPSLGDMAERAQKGATLSNAELLSCARLLRSARILYSSVNALADENITLFKTLTGRLLFDERLENEITEKILSETEVADRASEKLFTLRREIRALGEKIRARLGQYLTGGEKKFLQEGIVTMRGDRFVIPVKAEYKRSVKGFVHDRSQSGQTVFIEPEEVLEMNNELITLTLDEKEEVERILRELSRAVGSMREALERDAETLEIADSFYARAEYGYKLKCVKPALNAKGLLDIIKGRHPLLDQKTAVPVSVRVGGDYGFLVISGANTGGKTVTLKMCGLFSLMAACGLFVPAAPGTTLSVFREVFCDVGDSQSIEENLSTFSSHIVNLRDIVNAAGERDFVLIDEPGGGTDPEEGQALARAILSKLLKKKCKGIVTTHYSSLKEFAYQTAGVENGCMEFDAGDYRPLYRLKIGAPGSSNALAVSTRLGLPEEIIEEARGYLSEGARAFERTVRAAEESRIQAEKIQTEAQELKAEWEKKLLALSKEEEKFTREREKFLAGSKAEARRIVNERTAAAEELLQEIETIFKQESLTEADLIKARTLKNKMSAAPEPEEEHIRAVPVNAETLKAGDTVLVGSMGAEGKIVNYRAGKKQAEVQIGALRVRCELSDLYVAPKHKAQEKKVTVVRNLAEKTTPLTECNIIGMTVLEAIPEVERFLDSAILSNLAEVRIVHGMGTGKLRAAVHSFLQGHRRVEAFRLGKYGEGESGVTVVTLR